MIKTVACIVVSLLASNYLALFFKAKHFDFNCLCFSCMRLKHIYPRIFILISNPELIEKLKISFALTK